jgi:hypothetical protein
MMAALADPDDELVGRSLWGQGEVTNLPGMPLNLVSPCTLHAFELSHYVETAAPAGLVAKAPQILFARSQPQTPIPGPSPYVLLPNEWSPDELRENPPNLDRPTDRRAPNRRSHPIPVSH